ncbi:MAG: DHHW family protein [Anaerolineaceae bacterium]|nr:DHHW family protein [Anaerolineaceae bacterium]
MNPRKRPAIDIIFVLVILGMLVYPAWGRLEDLDTFDKNFGGREQLVKIVNNFRYHKLGERLFNRVLRGDEDWLVYTDENNLDDYQNSFPFSEQELALIQQKIDNLRANLEAQGIRFYVIIPPNKETIYPERVPVEVPILGSESRLGQLVAYLERNGGTQIIDLRPALRDARTQNQVYFRTDTHWNRMGAYVAYQETASILSADFPAIVPHPLEDFELEVKPFSGDLSLIAGELSLSEESEFLNPRFSGEVTRSETVENDTRYLITENPHPDLPRAVIFRDSFFESVIPLLSNHFSRSVNAWNFTYDPALVERESPDLVIYECTERYLKFLLQLP